MTSKLSTPNDEKRYLQLKETGLPVEHCSRCGHSWIPRTDLPAECPRCTSKYWACKPKGEK